MRVPRLLLTSGEPAGIGPELILQVLQSPLPAEIIVLCDPELLQTRAQALNLPLKLIDCDLAAAPKAHQGGRVNVLAHKLKAPCVAGELNPANAAYVIDQLETAHQLASEKLVDAIITAPVHKAVINAGGIAFQGHTEFFAKITGAGEAVMAFVTHPEKALVALTTTHLALQAVPKQITLERVERVLRTLHQSLKTQFGKAQPLILVAGLNPHAGEGGYLGREEIEVIEPVLAKLQKEGMDLRGPFAADTLFSEENLNLADAILGMFHDQALPVVKYLGFGQAVNVTLGLPYIRTSVDHGTALSLAGTGKAHSGSIRRALEVALQLSWVRSA